MTNLPNGFVHLMTELLGDEQGNQLCSSLDTMAPVSIRLSRHRQLRSDIIDSMGKADRVPWCPYGFYLSHRPAFAADPAWHAGGYYVQEASSMLLHAIHPLVEDSPTPLYALDLCAAPGGKSTLLSDMLPSGSTLVSNEVVPQRAHILVENMQKWGSTHHIVTSASPERLGTLCHAFDLILVDAPCSGEGMFRKDPDARTQWTPDSPALCAQRQRAIIDDIWEALRPGGLMVYSTCTFNRLENEDILTYLTDELGATALPLEPLPPGILPSEYAAGKPCYRMMPHRTRGEGLFMAVVRKHEDTPPMPRRIKGATRSATVPPEVRSWVLAPETYHWAQSDQNEVFAYPPSLLPMVMRLQAAKVPILSAGIPVATVRGRSVLPHPALAYSTARAQGAIDEVSVPYETAIDFLSREAITLPHDTPVGLKLICYDGIPLGYCKHLGNRTNNLYPTHWRIRHAAQVRDAAQHATPPHED